uniref:Pro-neuregulin-4, membrane-bound isoform n=1 Tax=Ornithorhynchus anatinus TaxID=9258 RepID=A0A6I8N356_ORNAN
MPAGRAAGDADDAVRSAAAGRAAGTPLPPLPPSHPPPRSYPPGPPRPPRSRPRARGPRAGREGERACAPTVAVATGPPLPLSRKPLPRSPPRQRPRGCDGVEDQRTRPSRTGPGEEEVLFFNGSLPPEIKHQNKMPTDHEEPCGFSHRSFCLNGGICYVIPTVPSPFCRCIENYTGARCEEVFLPSTNIQTKSELFATFLALAILLGVLTIGAVYFLCRKGHLQRANSTQYGVGLVETGSSSAYNKAEEEGAVAKNEHRKFLLLPLLLLRRGSKGQVTKY